MRSEPGGLREIQRLSPATAASRAVELALAAGFPRAGIVDPRLLGSWPPGSTPRAALPPFPGGLDWEWIRSPSRWSAVSTILVCCLSCLRAEPDDRGSPGDPHARVAPFARAHYYREAVRMLDTVARRLEQDEGLARSSVRLFSNSRIPEKPLAAAAGLGAYGKNGLLIVPGLGSMFVIAGAVLPLPTPQLPTKDLLPDPCGSCRSCQAACPAGALDQPYFVQRDRCLQSRASVLGAMDESTMRRWGTRLYGCQECQAACPHNRGLETAARPATGEIGPSVPLRQFLSATDEERRARLRGTALGMSWVPSHALLRNALVAGGAGGDRSVRALVERYRAAGFEEPVRAAARWALDRLT